MNLEKYQKNQGYSLLKKQISFTARAEAPRAPSNEGTHGSLELPPLRTGFPKS